MRQIALMSNRLITRLSHPECHPKSDFNNSRGGLGGQTQQGFEPSEPSSPKFTLFPGGLEALHSGGLSHPQTNHVLRRVSPIRGAYYVSRIDHPCEARVSTIQPPVMTKDFT